MKPRILIVEDEPAIADTLQYALSSDGFETFCCVNGADALARIAGARDAPFDLILLDVGLPDVNGFDLFRRIQPLTSVPVVFLTARSDEIDRVVGLELGADDYIAKPFSPRELVARVRMILRRAGRSAVSGPSAGSPGSPSGKTPFQLDDERRQIRYFGRVLELSRYEFGLLRVLLHRPGRVFTRDELLAQVWDEPDASFDRTVDAHIKTLRAKLKLVAPEVEPIRTHRGTGYALAEDWPT